MSDGIAKFEFQRIQLTASLTAVAESMRNCASFVETFAATIQGPQIATGLSFVPDDGLTKGVKRKAVDHDEESDPKKRKRKPRDPNAPKRPASSYILFQNDIRKELKEKHPNVPNNELLAMISKLWNDMPDQEKKHYNEAVASAKEQYSQEKKAYDSRSPEEVAAANAAAARAKAEKKTKSKAPKAPAAPAPATAPVPQTPAAETSPSSNSDSTSESEDASDEEEVAAAVNGKLGEFKQAVSDSEEEEEEEEEEERPPIVVVKGKGKSKGTTLKPVAPAPAPKEKRKRAGKA